MTDVTKIIADIVALQDERSEIDEAIEFKKAKLAEVLGKGDHTVGSTVVSVYQSKQFNAAYGKTRVPEEVYRKAYDVAPKAITAATAKAVLTAEEYALFQKPSDKLSVKLEVIND